MGDLRKVRNLVAFDRLTVTELSKGLKGRLNKLVAGDDGYLTRIEQVKKYLGPHFGVLLASTPEVVKEAVGWKNEEITQIRHYLQYVNDGVMTALSPLPFEQKVGLLDGLRSQLGRAFIEKSLCQPTGISVVTNIVVELREMAE